MPTNPWPIETDDPPRSFYATSPWSDPNGKQWWWQASKGRWNPYPPAGGGGGGAVDSVNGMTGAVTITKSTLSLGNVQNINVTTWAGSTSLVTLGTVGTGVWQGTPIADSYIASAATWNAKQSALVSGTNIKTVNGNSLLGSGDLVIAGVGDLTSGPVRSTSGTSSIADGALNLGMVSGLTSALTDVYTQLGNRVEVGGVTAGTNMSRTGGGTVSNPYVFNCTITGTASADSSTFMVRDAGGWTSVAGLVLLNSGSGHFTQLSTSADSADYSVVFPTKSGTVAMTSDLHTRSHAITSTSDHTAGNWKVFYSNGSGQLIELALGTDGQFLKSNGPSVAPSFASPAGGGDALTANNLDQFADVTHTPGAALSIAQPTTLAGGTHSGTNTGDVTITGNGLSLTGQQLSLSIGTGATQVASGDHGHAQLHDRSHSITSTSDHTAGNWKVFYSNGSGQLIELSLGTDGTYLKSNGASLAPSFDTPAGSSPPTASQAEMEAGTEAGLRSMSPLLVAQAIAALAGSGGAPADYTTIRNLTILNL